MNPPPSAIPQPKQIQSANPNRDEPTHRSWTSILLPPAIAFLAAQAFLMILADLNGYDPMEPGTWFRGDSAYYCSIATSGYTLYQSDGTAGYPPGMWLGNAGWMPLYPWMIRSLLAIGIGPALATIGLVLLFHFCTLAILWNRFLRDVDDKRAFTCLLLAAFCPGQIYYHAIFPISLLTLLTVIFFDRLLARRWLAAGAAGLLAGMSYAVGFLLGPIATLFLLLPPYGRDRATLILKRSVLVGLMPLIGLALFLLVLQIRVGAWNGFFLVQARYGHGLHNPFMTLFLQLRALTITAPVLQTFRRQVLPEIIVVAALTIAAVCWGVARWKHHPPLDRLLTLSAAVFWLFPLSMGMGVIPMRSHACMLPMIPLARKLPLYLQAVLLITFAILSISTSKLFFDINNL
jgi:hypothetical protein